MLGRRRKFGVMGWRVRLSNGAVETVSGSEAPNPRIAVAIALRRHGGYPKVKVKSVRWTRI